MPWATVAAVAGVYAANLGAPIDRPMRLPSNCRNCGAAHEPGRCSYCLTPSEVPLEVSARSPLASSFGCAVLRPEMVVRLLVE